MSVRRNALAALTIAIASAAPLSGAFAGDEWRTIDHDGMERRYLIHTPEAGARAPHAAVIALYGVDPGRVYVAGMSNGAMMAHRLGAELPDKVAASASGRRSFR